MRVVVLVVRTLWRYFATGQSVRGRATDNATFLQAASRDYRDKPIEKLSGPIWQRLARRWAVLGVPLTFMALSVAAHTAAHVSAVDPAWTRVQWLAMAYRWWAVLALGVLAYGTWQGIQMYRHRRTANEFVYPTWQAACGVLGLPYHRRDARHMVSLPDGFEPADVVEEPAEHHHWLLRITQIARILDWWALRRLTAERAEAEQVAEQELAHEPSDITPPEPHTEEPDTVPSAELVVRDRPGWLVYTDRFRTRAGSSAIDPPDVLEEPVRISLPPGKCGAEAQRKAFLNAVGPVLGMPDPKPDWVLRGRHPYVELRPNRPPPPAVTFAQIRRHFAAADMPHPVIGLAAGNRVVTIDYDNNSPHVLVSGGAGTGKSTLLKTILCQRMHLGAGLIVLDYKRVSHRWAHNLPGCIYAWRIEELHQAAVLAGQELERRIATVLPDHDDTEVELVPFRTVDLLVEEINSLTPQLQAYWVEIRGPGDPLPSPAVAAIRRIVNMGRELSMHVHIGAQRASANVFGANGGDIRESFQTRLMAKWTKQTWGMLAGGAPYQRFTGGGRGVWARVQDDEVEIVRVPFLTNQQAREWATSGVPCPGTPLGGDLSMSPAGPPAGVTAPELVTLSKALEYLPGMTLPALRQAAHREAAHKGGNFPPPSGEAGAAKTYDLEELITWKLAKDESSQLDEAWQLPEPRREGRCYRLNALDEASGAVVCGYVGQTWREVVTREGEHRGDKPFSDLIVGSAVEIWSGLCTQEELDAQELHFIHTLLPLYNIEGQEGAPHAIPKWTQIEQRQARNAAQGLPPWVPVDVYSERKAAVI